LKITIFNLFYVTKKWSRLYNVHYSASINDNNIIKFIHSNTPSVRSKYIQGTTITTYYGYEYQYLELVLQLINKAE
jgi:hypothetical protein